MENEMKTQARTRRGFDYRYSNGIIGQYRGKDIYVIPKNDFTIEQSKQEKNLIFAVSSLDTDELILVGNGMVIGFMTADGSVQLYDKSRFYGEEKKAVPQVTEQPLPQTSASGKTIEDYLAGETLVDRFLREMRF